MKDFKLLAIRPLAGCDSKFTKTLIPKTLYTFYSNVKFFDSDGKDSKLSGNQIANIIVEENLTTNLFSNFNNSSLTINISAIVGGNGSGKSSLSELLYAAICSISIQQGFLPNTELLTKEINDANESLQRILETRENKGAPSGRYISTPAIDRYRKEIEDKEDKIRNLEKFTSEVKVELYYQLDDRFYCIFIDKETDCKKISGNVDFIDLFHNENVNISDFFFYTIALNYSSYGLNSTHIGDWIEMLFHKNDGYKTPLVINPMRTQGDYKINTETHLSQTRVLSNIINESINVRELLEGKSISNIVFQLSVQRKDSLQTKKQIRQSDEFLKKIKRSPKELIEFLLENILGLSMSQISNIEYSEIKHIDLIEQYIIQKLFKIARTYEEYKKEHYKLYSNSFILREGITDFNGYVKKLNKDKSHKTLKLRQILWLIYLNTLKEEANIQWINDELKLPIDTFKLILKKIDKPSGIDIKELIPIAFYTPKIVVENESSYEFLSSGEQQLINALNTIYYHISNLESVFNSVNQERIEYRNICILLDEIELYFHPNFQRRFIYELLIGIKELDLKHIQNINILFCTHSPFVLSDIPSCNILRLEKGNQLPQNKFPETFGANIHDLLANDFFLKNGFIGEFAKQSIKEIIEYLDSIIAQNEQPGLQVPLKKQWNQALVKGLIDLMGEPLIKNSLLDLYNKAYYNNSESIDAEIARLIKRKEQLN